MIISSRICPFHVQAWDWNDQEVIPEEHEKDDSNGKENDVGTAKPPALEAENQWDKLLKSRCVPMIRFNFR